MYKMSHPDYDKLLTENIIQKYEHTNLEASNEIDAELNDIARELNV